MSDLIRTNKNLPVALLSTVSLHGSTRSSYSRLMRHFNAVSPHKETLRDYIATNAFVSVRDWLIPDKDEKSSQTEPRQITNAHYCVVKPEPCSSPYLVAASPACMQLLNLPQDAIEDPAFIRIFSGNQLVEGLDQPYALNYGCHSHGQWFGQLGDGRAMGLGEIKNSLTDESYELQLKGCGRSPFSRGFDGRAVMRSSVREFLASESMHHLGVSSTRALSIIGTGDDVQRPWYDVTSTNSEDHASTSKYPPNMWKTEPGAVVCRVAKSFLRLGHLELFAIRGEYSELIQLADYVCLREFPHLLQLSTPARYIQLYKEIISANVNLVVEWMRVGYVQGNMNSDNTCLAGRTIDYGPFGWMESFDPKYQPFTTDRQGNFCFIMQPSAMQVNLIVLGEKTFIPLIRESMQMDQSKKYSPDDIDEATDEITRISKDELSNMFWTAYESMKRKKLGLISAYSESKSSDREWWILLEKLLATSRADYTIFFRELSSAATHDQPSVALQILSKSFNIKIDEASEVKWIEWLTIYLDKIAIEKDIWSTKERILQQNKANPKYILRNWMALMAYEAAEAGSFDLIEEILAVLTDPYDLNHEDGISSAQAKEDKWYRRTPEWATNMPGCTFMSCSS